MVIYTHAIPTHTAKEKIPKWTHEVKISNLTVKLIILVGKWRYFRLNLRKNLHFYSFWPILDKTYAFNHKKYRNKQKRSILRHNDQFGRKTGHFATKLTLILIWTYGFTQFWRFYSSESLKFRVWKWLRVIKSSPLSKALIKTSDTLETTRSQDLCIR